MPTRSLATAIGCLIIMATTPADAASRRHPAWLVGHYATGSAAECYQGQSFALLPNGIWTTGFSEGSGGTWAYDRGYITSTTLWTGGEPRLKPQSTRNRIRWTKQGHDEYWITDDRFKKLQILHNFRCGAPAPNPVAIKAVKRILRRRH